MTDIHQQYTEQAKPVTLLKQRLKQWWYLLQRVEHFWSCMPSLHSLQLLILCKCIDWIHGDSMPTTLLCVMMQLAMLLATHLLLVTRHSLAGQCCSGVNVHMWLKASSKTLHTVTKCKTAAHLVRISAPSTLKHHHAADADSGVMMQTAAVAQAEQADVLIRYSLNPDRTNQATVANSRAASVP